MSSAIVAAISQLLIHTLFQYLLPRAMGHHLPTFLRSHANNLLYILYPVPSLQHRHACMVNQSINESHRHTESADAATDRQLQTRSEGFPSGQVGDGGQPLRTASDTRPQSMAAAPGPPRSQQAPVMGLVVGQQVHVPPAQQRQQDQAEIMNLATQVRTTLRHTLLWSLSASNALRPIYICGNPEST